MELDVAASSNVVPSQVGLEVGTVVVYSDPITAVTKVAEDIGLQWPNGIQVSQIEFYLFYVSPYKIISMELYQKINGFNGWISNI